MQQFISSLIIIVILGIITLTLLSVFGFIQPNKNSFETEVMSLLPKKSKKPNRGYNATIVMSGYRLYMLNETGKIIDIFDIPSNELEKGVIIGIDSDCDIVIKNKYRTISAFHAKIGKDEKGVFLIDNDSTNGVYDVQNNKVVQIDLENNTKFYLADHPFKFEIVNARSAHTQCKTNETFKRVI